MQGRPSLRRSERLRSSTKRRSARTSAAMEALPAGEKLSEMGACLPFSGEGPGRHPLLKLGPSHGTVREGVMRAVVRCVILSAARLPICRRICSPAVAILSNVF